MSDGGTALAAAGDESGSEEVLLREEEADFGAFPPSPSSSSRVVRRFGGEGGDNVDCSSRPLPTESKEVDEEAVSTVVSGPRSSFTQWTTGLSERFGLFCLTAARRQQFGRNSSAQSVEYSPVPETRATSASALTMMPPGGEHLLSRGRSMDVGRNVTRQQAAVGRTTWSRQRFASTPFVENNGSPPEITVTDAPSEDGGGGWLSSLLPTAVADLPFTFASWSNDTASSETAAEGGPPNETLMNVMSLVRKLSQAFFANQGDQTDLMNDWELAGNKNSWVCPSDRHLALRAQLKSGWSVHTNRQKAAGKRSSGVTAAAATSIGGASVRSSSADPTTISDAERAQIAAVLAKADDTKKQEENRIGKLVDRLANMRRQALGNGVTQCMLCCADFGLLGSMRSYGAMCYDCRKYVCQKNCGVDTYDQKLNESVFLCKLCSESREIWKKTGAWFYHDLPKYNLPPSTSGRYSARDDRRSVSSSHGFGGGSAPSWANVDDRYSSNEDDHGWPDRRPMGARSSREKANGRRAYGGSPTQSSSGDPYYQAHRQRQQPSIPPDPHAYPPSARGYSIAAAATAGASPASSQNSARHDSYRRVLPKVPQQTEGRPSPRIQPKWVMEQVGSSMSYDETSSDEELGRNANAGPMADMAGASVGSVVPRWAANSRRTAGEDGIQRINVARRKHTLNRDSDSETAPAESQSPTPPSSPRLSVATASSHGDLDSHRGGHGGHGGGTGEHRDNVSDSRSVDSGVVQSDHSQSTVRPSSSLHPMPVGGIATAGTDGGPTSNRSQDSAFHQSASQEAMIHADHSAFATCSARGDGGLSELIHSNLSLRHSEGQVTGSKSAGSGLSQSLRKKAAKQSHSVVSELPSSPDEDDENYIVEDDVDLSCPLEVVNEEELDRCRSLSATPLVDETRKRSLLSHVLARGFLKRAETVRYKPTTAADDANLGTVEFTLNFNAEEQTLIVNMHRAKGLRAMDSNGLSDPFVKLNLLPGGAKVRKSTKLRTKTIPKSLNPEWDETLTYYGITEEDKNKKTLRLQVMDEDRIGSDFLGETRIPLKKVQAGKERTFHVYLEKQMPVDLKTSQQDLNEPGKILLTLQYDSNKSSLLVTVIRCAELVGMDGSGYSDPYCKLALMPLTSKGHKHKTKVKRKTCNPEFNEEFPFRGVTLQELPSKTLEISVFDRDVGRHDDFIGGIVLGGSLKGERGRHWTKCLQNPGEKFKSWHRLAPDHTGAG